MEIVDIDFINTKLTFGKIVSVSLGEISCDGKIIVRNRIYNWRKKMTTLEAQQKLEIDVINCFGKQL